MLRLIKRQLPFREAEVLIRRHVYGSNVSDGAIEMNVNSRTFPDILAGERKEFAGSSQRTKRIDDDLS